LLYCPQLLLLLLLGDVTVTPRDVTSAAASRR